MSGPVRRTGGSRSGTGCSRTCRTNDINRLARWSTVGRVSGLAATGPALLRAYVDETGDRGCSSKSSAFFAFAAVVIANEDEPRLRAVMSQLRRDMKVPVGKALHWKDHVKTFPRRQHVARALAGVPDVRVIYVVVEKAAIPSEFEAPQGYVRLLQLCVRLGFGAPATRR